MTIAEFYEMVLSEDIQDLANEVANQVVGITGLSPNVKMETHPTAVTAAFVGFAFAAMGRGGVNLDALVVAAGLISAGRCLVAPDEQESVMLIAMASAQGIPIEDCPCSSCRERQKDHEGVDAN